MHAICSRQVVAVDHGELAEIMMGDEQHSLEGVIRGHCACLQMCMDTFISEKLVLMPGTGNKHDCR